MSENIPWDHNFQQLQFFLPSVPHFAFWMDFLPAALELLQNTQNLVLYNNKTQHKQDIIIPNPYYDINLAIKTLKYLMTFKGKIKYSIIRLKAAGS